MASTITITQGEDFTLNLAFTNANGSAYNLAGSTVRLLVRKNATTPPVVNIPITGHVDAPAGLTSIPLSGADTDLAIRAWQYQIILTDAHGEDRPSSVNTLRVTNLGSTTDSVTVTIGSNSVSIAMTLAGASGAGVAIGGTAGQVLTKNTTTDFDTGWHSLAKADVGLDQVDNTSDANKPVSTATATALATKASTSYVDTQDTAVAATAQTSLAAHTSRTDNPHATTKAQVGLGNVDNTSDASKPVSTAQGAAIALKGDKTYVDSQDAAEASARTAADNTLTSAVAAKYTKPGTGIPRTDLDTSTQTSLGKADSALQSAPVTSVAGKTGVVTLAEGDVANLTSDLASKANTSSLATVATTGAYSDLSGKPTIPTITDATTGAKGVVQLAGDLGGTAAAPMVNAATFTAAGKVKQTVFNVFDFGARADTKVVTDGAVNSGSTTLTSNSAAFTSANNGNLATITGAGASGGNLACTITYISATSVSLSVPAGTSVSGATISFGSNDTAAFQSAINAAAAVGGGKVVPPPGTYTVIAETINMASNVALEGLIRDKTIIKAHADGSGFSRILKFAGSSSAHVVNTRVANIFFSGINNSDQEPANSNKYAINTNYTDYIQIENVRTEWFGNAISLSNSTNYYINKVADTSGSPTGGTRHVIQLLGNTTGVVENCYLSANDTCLRTEGNKRLFITKNVFNNASVEIGNAEGFGYSEDITLMQNEWLSNSTNGLTLITFSDLSSDTKTVEGYQAAVNNIKVIGNVFRLSGSTSPSAITAEVNSGAATSVISNVQIIGNTMVGDGTNISTGITAMNQAFGTGRAVFWTIQGNSISDMGDEALNLTSLIDGQVSGNKIINFNARNGIEASARRSALRVAGNTSYNTSGLKIANNFIDGLATTNANGIYIDNPTYIDNLEITNNTIRNVTNPQLILSTVPIGTINFGNTNVAASGSLIANIAGKLNSPSAPPNSPNAPGVMGDFAWDSAYLYMATAVDTWARTPTAAWTVSRSLLFGANATDQVTAGTSTTLRNSVFTFTAWVKPNTTSANLTIIAGSSNGCPGLRINTSNRFELLKSAVASIGQSTGTIAPSVWTHVAVTYDASGNYAFYINGVASGTGTSLQSFTFSEFIIGHHNNGSEVFKGNIDEVMAYNTVLSSTQIASIYASATTAAGLQGYWKFNEASGASTADSSGLGNAGTITGAIRSTDVPFGGSSASTATFPSTVAAASLNIPSGVAPTSPLMGDIYSDGANLFCYLAGTWKQLT